MATLTGGAIYILGTTSYRVLDSIFQSNAVVPATWASTASYALIISTAGSGASEITSAMWSIDDAPVFGLSTADCGTAQQASAEGINRGLVPSWPGDVPCTNDTVYQPFELYTHKLSLAEGDHVLHLGVFSRGPTAAKWTGGGKVEVVGLLDQTFPEFDDDRDSVRHPGCVRGLGYLMSCPGGEAFWVDIPLHVGVGKVCITPPQSHVDER